jgi:hypothetical protein
MTLHTHSDRLERWLGAEEVANLSRAMKDFYWPIAVHGVPGSVFAMPGGDFTGEIRAGKEVSAVERASDTLRRMRNAQRARMAMSQRQLGAFSNLSALIAAATGGKAQNFTYTKTGSAVAAIGNAADLWTSAGQPGAGAAGSAAPGGKAWTNADAGSLKYANPVNANTGHFATGYVSASVVSNTLLLYDRLLSVVKTMASTTTEAVTGTFSRYQSATTTNADYIGGNFCFPSNPTTILAATAHNWTVCQYTDQAGNTANSFPTIAGLSACAVHAIDLAVGNWFMPLASGDVGVKALTQMQCDASVATGTIDFNVGHPIAFFPAPIANMICVIDGINTAFNLTNIYDNACLAFLEMPKPATTATTYGGQVTIVAE